VWKKFHLWNVGPMLCAAQAKPERGDKKRAFPGVAAHKTGFEKQILWQLPDKGC
jgi:hypothetical protein